MPGGEIVHVRGGKMCGEEGMRETHAVGKEHKGRMREKIRTLLGG